MSRETENYFLDRDKKNADTTRMIVGQLPYFAREFFLGIQMNTSQLTRLNYAYDLRIFFDYLSRNVFRTAVENITLKDLDGLKALDLELYMDYLTGYTFDGKNYYCSEQGKSRKLASLRSFFKYYFCKDKLEANVASKVNMPKIHEKPIVRLEPNEIAVLLDSIEADKVDGLSDRENAFHAITKSRDHAIVSLFLGTGIRISELVGLNKSDIDFDSGSFRVTRKGGSQSILYFSDEIAKPLNHYLNERKEQEQGGKNDGDSPLFLSLHKTRITVRAVQNLVKKYTRLISPLKKITPHKLRSTFGTELYRNTQDIYVVADVLGHKDINTTKKHYAAISDEIRRAASKAVKLHDTDENP